MYAKVVIAGKVFGDSKVSAVTSPSGEQYVVRFSLPYNSKKVGDKTLYDFASCTIWYDDPERAEKVSDLIKKGAIIVVEGNFGLRRYDKDGSYFLNVNVNNFRILEYAEKSEEENVKREDIEVSKVEGDENLPF